MSFVEINKLIKLLIKIQSLIHVGDVTSRLGLSVTYCIGWSFTAACGSWNCSEHSDTVTSKSVASSMYMRSVSSGSYGGGTCGLRTGVLGAGLAV